MTGNEFLELCLLVTPCGVTTTRRCILMKLPDFLHILSPMRFSWEIVLKTSWHWLIFAFLILPFFEWSPCISDSDVVFH